MNLKNPIRGVFFDLGWTLLYPLSGDWRFPPETRKRFPEDVLRALPDGRWAQALAAGEAYLDGHHLLRSVEEELAQWRTYYGILAEAVPELGLTDRDIARSAEEQAMSTGDYGLLPGVKETLSALKGHYRLGVISDTWPSIEPRLQALGIRDFFQCVTYSFSLGVFKPDPAMYRDALSKMGLPAGETVFIDDGAENLRGARAAGIQTVLSLAPPGARPVEGLLGIREPKGILRLLNEAEG